MLKEMNAVVWDDAPICGTSRMRQVHVNYLCLNGTDLQAASIDRLIGSGFDLWALREKITKAKADYALQKPQVDAWRVAVKAWAHDQSGNGPANHRSGVGI